MSLGVMIQRESGVMGIDMMIQTFVQLDGSGEIVAVSASGVRVSADAKTVVKLRLDRLEERLRSTVDEYFAEALPAAGKERDNG